MVAPHVLQQTESLFKKELPKSSFAAFTKAMDGFVMGRGTDDGVTSGRLRFLKRTSTKSAI
jgi:hypothetical protein